MAFIIDKLSACVDITLHINSIVSMNFLGVGYLVENKRMFLKLSSSGGRKRREDKREREGREGKREKRGKEREERERKRRARIEGKRIQ